MQSCNVKVSVCYDKESSCNKELSYYNYNTNKAVKAVHMHQRFLTFVLNLSSTLTKYILYYHSTLLHKYSNDSERALNYFERQIGLKIMILSNTEIHLNGLLIYHKIWNYIEC